MRTMTFVKIAIFFTLVVAVAVWDGWLPHSAAPQHGPAPAAARAAAPDFSLTDVDGKPLALSQYRGKVVLLDFWATWCTPCREETPHFVALQEKYRAQGLQIVGLSMDDDAKPVRAFQREFRMNYPVAMGTVKVAESYGGVLGLPVAFLIDRDGRIVTKYSGPVDMPELERQVASLLAPVEGVRQGREFNGER
jgi:peroxiredoxin